MQAKHLCVLIHIWTKGEVGAPLNRFKPSSKLILLTLPRRCFFRGSFMSFLSCVCYVLCASVYMCFVVACWERADLLALVCGVFCEFVTFPLVSWVRCGTWLYRFLIFAPLLTCFVMLWCTSVCWCLVVTCWERAGFLAIVCDVLLWSCHFPIGILGQVWC